MDGLDLFGDPGKRATVIELVRAAASVPAFQGIVTARTDFDQDEPNWLPADALAKLGRARPVVIDELGDEEIEELKAAAPTLRALLADDHPTRAVARNFFRLSRLLGQIYAPKNANILHKKATVIEVCGQSYGSTHRQPAN